MRQLWRRFSSSQGLQVKVERENRNWAGFQKLLSRLWVGVLQKPPQVTLTWASVVSGVIAAAVWQSPFVEVKAKRKSSHANQWFLRACPRFVCGPLTLCWQQNGTWMWTKRWQVSFPIPGPSLTALPRLLHPAVSPVPCPSLTQFCSHDWHCMIMTHISWHDMILHDCLLFASQENKATMWFVAVFQTVAVLHSGYSRVGCGIRMLSVFRPSSGFSFTVTRVVLHMRWHILIALSILNFNGWCKTAVSK